MYKLILTGTVTSTPEQYYSIKKNEYVLLFKFRCFKDDKLDSDEFEIICKDKFFKIAENYIHKGTNLLIEGSPIIYANKSNINRVVGIIKVLMSSLQFLDSELFIDDSSSVDLLELLKTLKEQLYT